MLTNAGIRRGEANRSDRDADVASGGRAARPHPLRRQLTTVGCFADRRGDRPRSAAAVPDETGEELSAAPPSGALPDAAAAQRAAQVRGTPGGAAQPGAPGIAGVVAQAPAAARPGGPGIAAAARLP